jgi:predicted membrane GTPase involved in stress response
MLVTIVTCTFIIGRKVEKGIIIFENMQKAIIDVQEQQRADKKELIEADKKQIDQITSLQVHQIRVDMNLKSRGIMDMDGNFIPEK